MNKTLESYRNQAIKAARDLRYSKETIEKIKKAKTIGEIERALITERHRMMKLDGTY